jgi:hypothetical protein
MGALSEQEAIARYLEERDEDSAWTSGLELALRDARTAYEHDTAIWLATLGYLIAAEQIGTRLARPSTIFPDRSARNKCFRAGILEFGPNPTDANLGSALWSLRCSLAHEYGLVSEQKRIFMLRRTKELIVHPTVPWDGSVATAGDLDSQTIVNVREVVRYVEDLVATARSESKAGQVVLAPGVNQDEFEVYGGIFVSC